METVILVGWYSMVAMRDTSALAEIAATDVVLLTPTSQAPIYGIKGAQTYLSGAFKVFFNSSFRYVGEIIGVNKAVLEFSVEIDGIAISGVDILSWNDEGKITEIKVMLRPLNSVTQIHKMLNQRIQIVK
jgi:hypothetical protein